MRVSGELLARRHVRHDATMVLRLQDVTRGRLRSGVCGDPGLVQRPGDPGGVTLFYPLCPA